MEYVYNWSNVYFVKEVKNKCFWFSFKDGENIKREEIDTGKYDNYLCALKAMGEDGDGEDRYTEYECVIIKLHDIVCPDCCVDRFIEKLEKGGLLHGENQPKSIRTS